MQGRPYKIPPKTSPSTHALMSMTDFSFPFDVNDGVSPHP